MSKILITGNGFDLFHHLPTKYGHFIRVMYTIETIQFNNEVSFEDLFGSLFKNKFSKDYESIILNYKVEEINFNSNKIDALKNLISKNFWYKHFKNILNIDTWIDFEMEIEKVLIDFSSIFEYLKENPNNFGQYKWPLVKVYNNYSEFGFSTANENTLMIVNEEFLDKKNKKIKEKEFLEKLNKSLEDFIVIFNRYLNDIVYDFYKARKYDFKIPFNYVSEIYTVNYTSTLEQIYSIDKSKIIYLHGNTNEDDNIQNLVLGISEIPQVIKHSKLYDFTKYYQKIIKKTNNKFIDIPKKSKSGLSENIFYIIGHSLDNSDGVYIKDLFKFLELDLDSKSKICIFFYDIEDKKNKLRNLFSFNDNDFIIEMEKNKRLYFVELNEESIITEFSKDIYYPILIEPSVFS